MFIPLSYLHIKYIYFSGLYTPPLPPPPPPPPPPLECIRGLHVCSHFIGDRGMYFRRSLGNISRESPGKGVFFVIANGNQYPRQGYISFLEQGGGGVQVMGNEHRHPLILWQWGAGVQSKACHSLAIEGSFQKAHHRCTL